jgi:hypothetical protein
MPSVLEDVCIKLLTAAENDPALARLVQSKSSNHSSPFTHSSQSCHGFCGNPETLVHELLHHTSDFNLIINLILLEQMIIDHFAQMLFCAENRYCISL